MFKDLFSHIRTIYHKVNLAKSSLNPMATDKPKVAGYLPPAVYNVPPAVYDQLMAFKAKRSLQSVEMAVNVILSEYFGLFQAPMVTGTDITASRLETLEAKCTSLSETVAELRGAIATLQASSSPPLGESESPADEQSPLPVLDAHATAESASNPAIDQSESPNQPFSTPMTQAALAKRLGMNTSTISRMQSKPNFSEWSQQKDPEGIAWVKSPDTKLFYPLSSRLTIKEDERSLNLKPHNGDS